MWQQQQRQQQQFWNIKRILEIHSIYRYLHNSHFFHYLIQWSLT
jgi:hypothetical protein